jgi:hypothetical protein
MLHFVQNDKIVYEINCHDEFISASHLQSHKHTSQLACGIPKQVRDDARVDYKKINTIKNTNCTSKNTGATTPCFLNPNFSNTKSITALTPNQHR